MVVSLKTSCRPSSREDITKQVFTGVNSLNLKDAGIQVWSGTIVAYRICNFIAWKGCYFKT